MSKKGLPRMPANQAAEYMNALAPDGPGQRGRVVAASAADSALAFMQRKSPARVLHVFRDVCNLTNSTGYILSLTLNPRQMASFSIALDQPEWLDDFLRYLDADSHVLITARKIELGPLEIQVDAPARWNSQPDWDYIRSGMACSSEHLDRVGAILQNRADPESLAVCSSGWTGEQDPVLRRWWRAALDPIQALLRGLVSLDQDLVQQAAGRLAGLGPGLTPAGDDFMIGSMHAIWSLMKPGQARALCGSICAAATPLTNVFSAAHLRAAACGEAAAHWQTLLAALSAPGSDDLIPAVGELLAQGHTSGQDALSGFLLTAQQLKA
ncbi:MAG: DUF2877 domain-containing protein [Anaerolineales bacterium]